MIVGRSNAPMPRLLIYPLSDHKPLLIHTSPNEISLPKPFRFKTFWTTLPQAARVIDVAWAKGFTLLSKNKNTKVALKNWYKNSVGQIQNKISHLKNLINDIQANTLDPNSAAGETMIQRDLDEFLKCEELLWKDKSKTRQMEEGDVNTHYFHVSTLIHRRYNPISRILDDNQRWITNRNDIDN